GDDSVCGARRKAPARTRPAAASPAKTDRGYRRDHVEEFRQKRITEPRLDRRDPAGTGRRLSSAPPDRSGDHAGRQLPARDRRSTESRGKLKDGTLKAGQRREFLRPE